MKTADDMRKVLTLKSVYFVLLLRHKGKVTSRAQALGTPLDIQQRQCEIWPLCTYLLLGDFDASCR